jgi:hypothetical protein
VVFVPLQPPEAVQAVAFDELHVSTDEPPLVTMVGVAVIVALGATFTVTLAAVLVPPAPVQVSEYSVPLVSAPVLCVPLGALVPFQPPAAVQAVAFDEVHASLALPPLATDSGLAESVATGSTSTVTLAVALPPAPAQVSV